MSTGQVKMRSHGLRAGPRSNVIGELVRKGRFENTGSYRGKKPTGHLTLKQGLE